MKIAKFKIEEWMNLYESSSKYDLMGTCIKPLSLNELYSISSVDLNPIFNRKLDYGDITGSFDLKYEIKKLYKTLDTNNIAITHGAIGANQLVFLATVERRDEVVSIVPTYQQHYAIPESMGVKVNLVYLKEKNNWLPDLNEIDMAINKRTKLLCLNNPNNPTGSIIPESMLREIIEIAKRNNVWILSDEVYRGLNLSGEPYSVSIADLYEKGISVGSMSKTYSLPGLRVGWIAGRSDFIEEINHQRQYNTISVSILDDYFAAVALKHRKFIESRNRAILETNFDILKNWLKCEPKVKCILPSGGTTALIQYKENVPSCEFCHKLQAATGVGLLPGETMEMEGYARLGFCAENLEEALINISNYLNRP